tara:strand:- start:134703 stop:135536 length:834 start_codon:yes stop_codon:yes gene_type:complete
VNQNANPVAEQPEDVRRYVVGDIHGCAKALRSLVETIAPRPKDQLVFLGDYVDRGPDSRDVIEQLIQVRKLCRTVMLRGNHEIMLGGVVFRDLDPTVWLGSGGKATVASYGGDIQKMPEHHRDFLKSLRPHYETTDSIFVHACYESHLPMDRQDDSLRYWAHLTHLLPAPHISGKRVFVGHTPQMSGRILDAGHLICVDTHCVGNGYLTAYDIDNNHSIQVDRRGHVLRSPAKAAFQKLLKFFRSGSRKQSHKPASAQKPNSSSADPSLETHSNLHG